ncbi:mCG144536, partial [Mus musculus]
LLETLESLCGSLLPLMLSSLILLLTSELQPLEELVPLSNHLLLYIFNIFLPNHTSL